MNAATDMNQGKRKKVLKVRGRSGCMPRRVVALRMVRRRTRIGAGYRPTGKVGS